MAVQNLTIKRGDDKYYNLTFTDEDGVAIDITDWTVYMTIKEKKDDSDDDAIITKDVTSHTDPTNGKTRVHLTHTETNDYVGNYYYDIQIKQGNGDIMTVVEGQVVFSQDITRRS